VPVLWVTDISYTNTQYVSLGMSKYLTNRGVQNSYHFRDECQTHLELHSLSFKCLSTTFLKVSERKQLPTILIKYVWVRYLGAWKYWLTPWPSPTATWGCDMPWCQGTHLTWYSSISHCYNCSPAVKPKYSAQNILNIFYKNSPMQPFEFVIIFNMTTCFGKIIFPSSGPRYTIRNVVWLQC
jgi:hypothetical protein